MHRIGLGRDTTTFVCVYRKALIYDICMIWYKFLDLRLPVNSYVCTCNSKWDDPRSKTDAAF